MADAFKDRIDSSLKAIQEHFDGEKKISVKEKNKLVGFDAYKKAIDLSDVVILTTLLDLDPITLNMLLKMKNMFSWKNL